MRCITILMLLPIALSCNTNKKSTKVIEHEAPAHAELSKDS